MMGMVLGAQAERLSQAIEPIASRRMHVRRWYNCHLFILTTIPQICMTWKVEPVPHCLEIFASHISVLVSSGEGSIG